MSYALPWSRLRLLNKEADTVLLRINIVLFLTACVIFYNLTELTHPSTLGYALLALAIPWTVMVPNFVYMTAEVRRNLKQLPCTITVHRWYAYFHLLKGVNGIAESYIAGLWDCDHIDKLVCFLYEEEFDRWVKRFPPVMALNGLRHVRDWFYATRFGEVAVRAFARDSDTLLVEKHYNIGNDFFGPVLGPTRCYTCAQWENGTTTLEDAQLAKFESIHDRLGLKPGDRILDLGCGNAPYIRHAVEHRGVSAVGITTSEEMAKSGREFCTGYPVEIRVVNYKDLQGLDEQFDAIVSIGMFEAVPPKEYALYAQTVWKLLKPGGLYFHHCIVRRTQSNDTRKAEEANPNPWIDSEIFPGGFLPTVDDLFRLSTAVGSWPSVGLRVRDRRILDGSHYDQTLMAWNHNMRSHWSEISKNPKYDHRFFRKWDLWIRACAGSFRARQFSVAQLVYEKVTFTSD